MSAEQDGPGEPTAFGLVRITPALQQAIDAAYEQLARGVPGEIEIPLSLPLLPARKEHALGRSLVPHARALQTTMVALAYLGDQQSCAVTNKICEAFDQVITTRPANATLVVGRQRPPRIRTCIRGGRTRYVSSPIQQLAPPAWAFRASPGYPLRVVAREHHRH